MGGARAGPWLCAAALAAAPASADELSVGGHGVLDARYLRVVDDGDGARAFDGHIDAGLRLRAMAGLEHVQLAIGLDFHLGATHPGGFAHAAHIRPIGAAFGDGEGLRLSVTAGIGFDGVTARLPLAMRVPVDLLFELPLGDLLKLEVGGELAWLPREEARQGGSRLEGVDETALVVRLRLDRRYNEGRAAANGYFIGLELAERLRAASVGVAVGYGFDGTYGL
jgi:hypothetical protein